MSSKTVSLALHASKDDVFSYLSDAQNLPRWATIFCKELRQVDGKYKVITTTNGELFFDIVVDKNTGVVDMYAGPNEKQMDVFPVRVIDLPGGACVILFTMFQTPVMSDDQFMAQHQSLLEEFENLKIILLAYCK